MQPNPQKKNLPSKAEKKPYIRSININGTEVQFVVNDAMYANILNEEMLIDKLPIDFMLDEIAAIQTNPSKNTPIPKTVLISQEHLNELLDNKKNTTPQEHLNELLDSDKKSTTPQEHINELLDSDKKSTTPFDEDDLLASIIKQQTETKANPSASQEDDSKITPDSQKPVTTETQKNIDSKITADSNKQKDIVNPNDQEVNDTLKKAASTQDFLQVYKPRYTFDEVYVDPVFKRRIISALIMAKERKRLYTDWGLLKTLKSMRPLVLNFYGPPGTGKSMMAEAIASYLKRDVFLVNYSELESGTPGETPKNIVKCFLRAKAENCVLIFDEADSFLGKRLTNVSSAADYGVNITRSVMLIELEKFEGVIIFTTNFISNYDIAFKRRILASVEFKLPDEKGRAHIWNSHIPSQLPLSSGITPMSLGYKYAGTTGADIKDIILFAAVNCLERGRERLSWEDFDEAYQTVKNRYAVV